MLSEATSGLSTAAGRTRSSTIMVGAPPEVRLITTFERCLITLTKCRKASGVWSGRPSCGLRAWRWTTAAPASAAPMAASAISCAVIGRCGDIDGVWIEPVTAQVMMTLFLATVHSLVVCADPKHSVAGSESPMAAEPCGRMLAWAAQAAYGTRQHARCITRTEPRKPRRRDRHRLRRGRGAVLGGGLRRDPPRHHDRLHPARPHVPPLLLGRRVPAPARL